MGLGGLINESLAGLLQRPIRTALTMLGILLGIGTFVAILGLTSTAGGQIDQQFNALTASTVTVRDTGASGVTAENPPVSFPADALTRIDALNGVVASGITYAPPGSAAASVTASLLSTTDEKGSGLPIEAVDPGTFAVTHARTIAGRTLDRYEITAHLPVAVLGAGAAARLNITTLTPQTVVFINGITYTVIGIVTDFQRLPELASAVMIPATVADDRFGAPVTPDSRPTMTIETRLGAAGLIARQAAMQLRPDQPGDLNVTAPQDPTQLRGSVQADINSLFLLLAGITLLIGAVSIGNITLVSVMERTGEIGLRRALGARRGHVAAQFMCESTATGLLGGIIGTSLGLATILLTALVKHWSAIIDPWIVPAAPVIGALVGAAAGLYPSLRAARIQPASALRR